VTESHTATASLSGTKCFVRESYYFNIVTQCCPRRSSATQAVCCALPCALGESSMAGASGWGWGPLWGWGWPLWFCCQLFKLACISEEKGNAERPPSEL
jgi:hypothetical protein